MIKICSLFFILFLTSIAFELSEDKSLMATNLIGQMINCKFENVAIICDSLEKDSPKEPLYPFLKLCAYGLRDLDFDRSVDSVAFMNAYIRCVKSISDYEKENGRTSYSITLSGFTNASHASYYLHHEKHFSAVGTGLDALNLLKEAQKNDTTNADADFFLGFYQYARGELKKRLWMVLFWAPGSTKGGKEKLQRSVNEGKITSEAAKMVLADIYIREKQYNDAYKMINLLLKKYPESRFIYWSLARYHEAQKEYLKAAQAYDILAQKYENEGTYGDFNGLVTRYEQIRMLDKANEHEKVIAIAKFCIARPSFLKPQPYEEFSKKISKYIKD